MTTIAQIRLTPIDASPDLPIIKQGSPKPVLRGSEPNGTDYICGVCGTMTLAESLSEGEVWDIAFRCHSCGGVSIGPRLPPGMPLPGLFVVFDPGEYLISDTVLSKSGVSSVGTPAINRRIRETGRAPTSAAPRHQFDPGDPNHLLGLIERVRSDLGEIFDELEARDRLGRAAKRTPPKDRHRLIEVVERVRHSSQTLAANPPAVNGPALIELHTVHSLLERWRHDPGWISIRDSMRNPSEYPHAVIQLAAASFLTDMGNEVGLTIKEVEGRGVPDLWISLRRPLRVHIEIKVPTPLLRKLFDFSETKAKKIIEKALSNAGTGLGGQLSPEHPGILLIGGFHVPGHQLDLLESAAAAVLRIRPERRNHIAAIVVLSLGMLIEGAQFNPGEVLATTNTSLTCLVSVRTAVNPTFSGAVEIRTTPLPGQPAPINEDHLQDFEFPS